MTHGFWQEPSSLVLASKSAVRRSLLEDAGVPVVVKGADIDERIAEAGWFRSEGEAARLAVRLASMKALAVSRQFPKRFVVGADQVLSFRGRCYAKPGSLREARRHLREFMGRTHQLISAAVVVKSGKVAFEATNSADMTMRLLSDRFIDIYLDTAGSRILETVGCYQVEGLGIQLFSTVQGSFSTILGLPMELLISFFREAGALAT